MARLYSKDKQFMKDTNPLRFLCFLYILVDDDESKAMIMNLNSLVCSDNLLVPFAGNTNQHSYGGNSAKKSKIFLRAFLTLTPPLALVLWFSSKNLYGRLLLSFLSFIYE